MPATTQRSQNPDTMSFSELPARPACVSHADSSAKKASFIPAIIKAFGCDSACATDGPLTCERWLLLAGDLAGLRVYEVDLFAHEAVHR
jgi:hypothetical protein